MIVECRQPLAGTGIMFDHVVPRLFNVDLYQRSGVFTGQDISVCFLESSRLLLLRIFFQRFMIPFLNVLLFYKYPLYEFRFTICQSSRVLFFRLPYPLTVNSDVFIHGVFSTHSFWCYQNVIFRSKIDDDRVLKKWNEKETRLLRAIITNDLLLFAPKLPPGLIFVRAIILPLFGKQRSL